MDSDSRVVNIIEFFCTAPGSKPSFFVSSSNNKRKRKTKRHWGECQNANCWIVACWGHFSQNKQQNPIITERILKILLKFSLIYEKRRKLIAKNTKTLVNSLKILQIQAHFGSKSTTWTTLPLFLLSNASIRMKEI